MSGFGARPAPSNTGMMWTGSSAAVPDEFGGVISSDCFCVIFWATPPHPSETAAPACDDVPGRAGAVPQA